MKKHLVHYMLILLLAIAPMQSVLAGLSALEHASACGMAAMQGDEHGGMQHTDSDEMDNATMQCDCCSDCMTVCVSATHLTTLAATSDFKLLATAVPGNFDYALVVNSQYPPTDIRPPIVLR